MKNIIRKLFKRERTDVTFEDGIKYIVANFPNISEHDFPHSQDRQRIPFERYNCGFSRLECHLVNIGGRKSSVSMKGKYHIQPAYNNEDSAGNHLPGSVSTYNFSIEDGKLTLARPY